MFPAPTFWTHAYVVHPEVIVLSFAAKMLTNCAWTPRFQSVAVHPAQGPFFSLPLFHCDVIAKLSSTWTQMAGLLDIPHRKHGENTHGGIFSFNPKPQIKQLFWGIHWIHRFQEFLPRLSSES